MSRCEHAPTALYDAPKSDVAAVLRPYRAKEWMRCRRCGGLGLKSRRSDRIAWNPPEASPSLIRGAAAWNAWNERMAAGEGAMNLRQAAKPQALTGR